MNWKTSPWSIYTKPCAWALLGCRSFGVWRLQHVSSQRFHALDLEPPAPSQVGDGFTRHQADDQQARVEAVLFLARQPLPGRKIAQIAGLDSGAQVRALVRRLNRLYDENRTAFRIMEVAGGFQLRTRAGFEPWIARLVKGPNQIRLSPPALETLTVIAYRQPILRAEIEAIRGVQCGEAIRQLLERGLIRVVGRSEELGRPYLYGTSSMFLEIFGLRGLDDLPHPEYRIPSAAAGKSIGKEENG
ncbi:MAG: SMC-Scp complex subunit ScpB [Thermogutta sp.]